MKCEFLERVLQARGGLSQWNSFETIQATIVTGGQLGFNSSTDVGGDQARRGFGPHQ
jgi:hypothetical protein